MANTLNDMRQTLAALKDLCAVFSTPSIDYSRVEPLFKHLDDCGLSLGQQFMAHAGKTDILHHIRFNIYDGVALSFRTNSID